MVRPLAVVGAMFLPVSWPARLLFASTRCKPLFISPNIGARSTAASDRRVYHPSVHLVRPGCIPPISTPHTPFLKRFLARMDRTRPTAVLVARHHSIACRVRTVGVGNAVVELPFACDMGDRVYLWVSGVASIRRCEVHWQKDELVWLRFTPTSEEMMAAGVH